MHCPMTDKRCPTPMTCHHESRCEAAANPLIKRGASATPPTFAQMQMVPRQAEQDNGCDYVSSSPTPMPPAQTWLGRTFGDITAELERAAKWPPFNSAHEGYSIMLEEMDELKAHVWMNQKKRDFDAMRAEAIQVAAMAIKFVQMMDQGRGRV